MNCFRCNINFEDKYDKYSICYVCRKSFCIICYEKHNHKNIDSDYEMLYEIIKTKSHTLYKPIIIYDFEYGCRDIYENALLERKTIREATRFRSDFVSFHRQLMNIKERHNYLFVEMIISKKFCLDIYELILSFL